jgi:hypothetical protein
MAVKLCNVFDSIYRRRIWKHENYVHRLSFWSNLIHILSRNVMLWVQWDMFLRCIGLHSPSGVFNFRTIFESVNSLQILLVLLGRVISLGRFFTCIGQHFIEKLVCKFMPSAGFENPEYYSLISIKTPRLANFPFALWWALFTLLSRNDFNLWNSRLWN